MRALVRLLFTLILLAIAAGVGYYYGYRAATGRGVIPARSPIDTSGSKLAGEAPAEATGIGKKLAEAGSEAREFLSDAALTTKIKSKMGLDDHVEARNIHVSTTSGVVTLTGTVQSQVEHARAVALARDTKGVKSVVDRLQLRK